MDKARKLNRRTFLRASAVTAATATLAACGGAAPSGGGAAQPTAAPAATAVPAAPTNTAVPLAPTTPPQATAIPAVTSQFKESPTFAAAVQGGSLPPVDQRLPKNPYTPPHVWLTPGKYGGVLKYTMNNNWGITGFIRESQYGHSILRWLKDGLAIGPGLAESWESNADASQWTFKFREGLKWSDGRPWTVKDIMYWWEDMAGSGTGEDAGLPTGVAPIEGPPDEARSGRGTIMKLVMVDDYTMQMVFDAPAPLTADRVAMWVNAGIGPRWMAPRHYMEQFNPKYNKSLADWEEHNKKIAFTNPDCPTMNGWKLDLWEDGVRTIWSANPYYWVVDKDGNQLPYISGINVTAVQDPQIEKLAYLEGQADHGHFVSMGLKDIQDLRDAQATSKIEVRRWDTGSGTGSMYFFNYDYKDEVMREVIRDPKFRQALSLAYNRADVQKAVYFGLGELTTGTLSPKAIEYNINDEGKGVYASWRDSFVAYDPEAAKKVLTDAGYQQGADGKWQTKDGQPMQIVLTLPASEASGSEHESKTQRLARDWQAIGLDAVITPVPGEGFDEKWRAGEYMMKLAWEVGDGPNHLVYPQWLVPIEYARWAPLHGTGYDVLGTAAAKAEKDASPWDRKPPRINPDDETFMAPIGELFALYEQSKVEPDAMMRHKLVWDMIKIHVENGPFFSGTIANPPRIVLVKEGLLNVPTRDDLLKEGLGGFMNPWIIPSPAVYDPETWYWDNPEMHAG